MKINIIHNNNNTEIIFNNIIRNKDLIYINSDFKFSSILTTYRINYKKFIELLETSLDSYVDLTNKDIIYDTIEQYFNYFKITSNSLVKKNMATKIAYILLNNLSLVKDTKVESILFNYISYKSDEYYTFLKIILNTRAINKKMEIVSQVEEEEYFTILDFILDYYE